jgi:hypothetical protein
MKLTLFNSPIIADVNAYVCLLVHIHDIVHINVHINAHVNDACPCSKSMPRLHAHVQAACSGPGYMACPCCMSPSKLHVHVQAGYPDQHAACCMNMIHGNVHLNMDRDTDMNRVPSQYRLEIFDQ